MPLSRRYVPEHPAGEACVFGMDFSPLIPSGVGIARGWLSISTNTVDPQTADNDWVKGPVEVRGRVLYARLSGGKSGTDYQLTWTAIDSDGNTWPRTALCLCSATS